MGSPNQFPRAARAATLLLAALICTACGGDRLTGKYYYRFQSNGRTKDRGMGSDSVLYEFKSGGKVNISEWGFNTFPTFEYDYVVTGNEIKITSDGQTKVGRIANDGCLIFGNKEPLCKENPK